MYSGNLYKLGQFIYKKRYFIIDQENNLNYYDSEFKLQNKRGSIDIKDILYFNISKLPSYNSDSCWGFEITVPGRVLYFYSSTEEERIYWIEAISTISSKLKQNNIDEKINEFTVTTTPQPLINNNINNNTEKIMKTTPPNTFSPQSPHYINQKLFLENIQNYYDDQEKQQTLQHQQNQQQQNYELILEYNILIQNVYKKRMHNNNNNNNLEIKKVKQLLKKEIKLIKSYLNNGFNGNCNILELEDDELNHYKNKNTTKEIINCTKDEIILKFNNLKNDFKNLKINYKNSKLKQQDNSNNNGTEYGLDNEILKQLLNNEINENEVLFQIEKLDKSIQESNEELNKLELDYLNNCKTYINEIIEIKYQLKNYKQHIVLTNTLPLKKSPTISINKTLDYLDSLVESVIRDHGKSSCNSCGISKSVGIQNNYNDNNSDCNSSSDNSKISTYSKKSFPISLSTSNFTITSVTNENCKWVIPSNFKKISTGFYQFGTKKINAKLLGDELVIRVGGGYMKFIDFVYKYGERESVKTNNNNSKK